MLASRPQDVKLSPALSTPKARELRRPIDAQLTAAAPGG